MRPSTAAEPGWADQSKSATLKLLDSPPAPAAGPGAGMGAQAARAAAPRTATAAALAKVGAGMVKFSRDARTPAVLITHSHGQGCDRRRRADALPRGANRISLAARPCSGRQ